MIAELLTTVALLAAASSVREERFLIPTAPKSPLRVFLRHLPPAAGAPRAGRVVLLVHGATFPSGLAAAYRLGGVSWMDDLAAHDFDVWALDFLGYGGSDRYLEMAAAVTAHGPLGRAPDAASQIAQAAEFIAARQGVQRISVVAHSWGTIPAGRFAEDHPERIERLVLFGPLAARGAPLDETAVAGAYNDVTAQEQWDNFLTGVPAGMAPRISPADFAAWAAAYLATDPGAAARTPHGVRVPGGPMADAAQADAGLLAYDPAGIVAPTLIIRGEWDAVSTDADAQWLLERLVRAPIRRYVVISRATHRMHLEASRRQLYREVTTFLDGGDLEQ